MRLVDYNYGQSGAYFVTIVTRHRESLFGAVANDRMVLNEFGRIVETEWLRTSEVRPDVALDTFVVMPNHLHGILLIDRTGPGGLPVGATRRVARTSRPAGPGGGTLGPTRTKTTTTSESHTVR